MLWYQSVLMESHRQRLTLHCEQDDAAVPTVRVHLLQTVRIPPRQRVLASAQVQSSMPCGPIIFEPDARMQQVCGTHTEDSLLQLNRDGSTRVPLDNPTGFTVTIQAGEVLGSVAEASIICNEEVPPAPVKVLSARMSSQYISAQEKQCQKKLKESVGELDLPDDDKEIFMSFLAEYHHTFCLEGERGETDLCMEINTGQGNSEPDACHSAFAKKLPNSFIACRIVELSSPRSHPGPAQWSW